MEAPLRSVQVGGPPGQRSDTGPPSQPPPTIAYQQRGAPPGASQIHRSVDTGQGYNKGGAPQPQSRSAASPLSPPRPGPGAATYAYPPTIGAIGALRYGPYGTTVPYRDNPYRVPQVAQGDYHRVSPVVSSTPNSIPISIGSISAMESNAQQHQQQQQQQQQQQRPQISLLPHGAGGGGGGGPVDRHETMHGPSWNTMEPKSRTLPPQQQPNAGPSPSDPGSTGPLAFKKIRLNDSSQQISQPPPPPSLQQQQQQQSQQQPQTAPAPSPSTILKVDTVTGQQQSVGAYHPQVEAISPTLPSDPTEELRAKKDDLLQQITKVDNEIITVMSSLTTLKKKAEELEEASSLLPGTAAEEQSEAPAKHRSLAQKIYAENRKRAATAHAVLGALGPIIDLPLYNQPQDVEICREIIKRHATFKQRLLSHFRKVKSERSAKQQELAENYSKMSQDWLKRLEKLEASAKRKAKEAKNREFFEKVFPELRKQREDKERFNRVGSRIKSEADLEEIMDNLQEQAMEDKKMRSYAVIPPLMLDSKQRRLVFQNENGSLIDMETEFKERQNLNVWTAGEKEIFREKFLQHPKNFGAIAASLDRKSTQDCVRYYYLSKKAENYKQLLRKSRQRTRSSKNPNKSNQIQSQSIVDALTTGVTTRLQREQQQKTGGRDRAANSTNNNNNSSNSSSSNSNSSSSNTSSTPSTITPQGAGTAKVTTTTSTTTTTASATASSSTATTTTTASTTTTSALTSTLPATPTTTTAASTSQSSATSTTPPVSSTSKTASSTSATTTTTAVSSAMVTTTPTKSVAATSQNNGSPANNSVAVNSITTTILKSEPIIKTETDKVTSSSAPSTATTSSATAPKTTFTNCLGKDTKPMAGSLETSFLPSAPNGLKTEVLSNATTSAPLAVMANNNNNNNNTLVNTEIKREKMSPALLMDMSKMQDADVDIKASIIMNSAVPSIGGMAGMKLKLENNIKEDVDVGCSEPKKRRKDTDASEDDVLMENKEKAVLHPCFICKTELCSRTRPLEKGRGQQYGIPEEAIPVGARVCNTCQCKSVKSRYTNCPLPTCPNPKDRVKRFRNLPPRLFELAPEIRDPIIQELQIPPNVTKCCSACLTRVRRKMGPYVLGGVLTDDEINRFRGLLQEIGPKWPQLAESFAKTPVALKSFYFHYKKKYGFDTAVTEYYQKHPSEDRRPAMTDGDESDMSASSSDEREGNSDTASAESPNNPIASHKEELQPPQQSVAPPPPLQQPKMMPQQPQQLIHKLDKCGPGSGGNTNDDRLLPPLGQPPRKQRTTEEYDSSATETADEENESSPANRQSPKVMPYTANHLMSALPHSLQNGPRDRLDASLNVQDFVSKMIEMQVKTGQAPAPPLPATNKQQPPMQHNMKPVIQQQQAPQPQDSRGPDITFIREFRNEVPKQQQQGQAQGPQSSQPQQSAPPMQRSNDGLATLSIVNSHHSQHPGLTQQQQQQAQSQAQQQQQQQMLSHHHNITSQIAATITPVPQSQQSQQPNVLQVPHDIQTKEGLMIFPRSSQQQQQPDPEPQTLDLSIKKAPRDPSLPPPTHKPQVPPPAAPNSGGITIYRSDPILPHLPQHQSNIPHQQQPTYIGHHHFDLSRPPTKSPSNYITVPVPISMGGQQQQAPPPSSMQHHHPSQRGGPPIQHNLSQTPPSKGGKLTPKLSPKIQHHQSSSPHQPQQMTISGPKGSITHGTPVNSAGQPMGMGNNGPATLSPRYDTILRQTPPSGDKIGSITQGTPVHLPTHHLPEKRIYEMYKSKGGSPHQPQQGSSPQNLTPQQQQQQQQQQGSPQSFSSPYGRPAVYQLDPPQPQLSSRQIIMNDYITSQQMVHGRSGPTGGSNAGGPPPGRSDKETPSPHNSGGPGGHPVTYYDANSERARAEFMSRKSQVERINRRPSPHRTPPPQRQGVIHANPGRHSTSAGSKLPSPASVPPTSRQLHMVQQHHYLPPGHEAFSSLVDVAVQQPLLPVPHKDDSKAQRSQPPVSVTITEPPSPGGGQPPSPHHHDIRYHLPSREQQISMQIQQQRQHQMYLQMDMQRRQQHHGQPPSSAQQQQQQQQQQVQAQQQAQAQQQHMHQQQAAAAAVQHNQQMAVAAAYREQQIERERQEQYRERERDRDRERIHQERDRIERQQQQDRDRERSIHAAEMERNMQLSRERERVAVERERERQHQQAQAQAAQQQAQQDEHDREVRRREESRMMENIPYMRGDPNAVARGLVDRERERTERSMGQPRTTGELITAGNLIDAIIKHQINQPPTGISRDGHRIPFFPQVRDPRDQRPPPSITDNGKSQSPNVINVDLDMEPPPNSRGNSQIVTKSLTLGELTDTIIAKDYGPMPMHPMRSPFMSFPQSGAGAGPGSGEQIVTTDQWKYHRRMQQKEEQQQQQQQQQMHQQQGKSPAGPGRSTPDERQILRMAQTPSPRTKIPFHEPVSPPETHFYQQQQQQQQMGGGQGGSDGRHQFALDFYVKNRIKEAMRTEDEKRGDDGHDRGDHHQQPSSQHHHHMPPHHQSSHGKDGDRSSTPGEMVIDEDRNDHHGHGPPPQHNSFHQNTPTPVTTYYPFSALSVSAGAPPPTTKSDDPRQHGMPPQQQQMPPTSSSNQQQQQQQQQQPPQHMGEPKPIMSAMYEALSDED